MGLKRAGKALNDVAAEWGDRPGAGWLFGHDAERLASLPSSKKIGAFSRLIERFDPSFRHKCSRPSDPEPVEDESTTRRHESRDAPKALLG